MKIINLTQIQFRNYSNMHPKRNFGQTIEYTHFINNTCDKLFLGLIDDEDNIHAASLILIRNINSFVKEAYAPNGFLVDYADKSLMEVFVREISRYLEKIGVTYLITNPMFYLRVYNKDNVLVMDNEFIYNNMLKLGFKNNGYFSPFAKYDVIISENGTVNEIMGSFNRNTRRNIRESLNMGIKLRKGKKSELAIAYEMFRKKSKNGIEYYQNLMKAYNSKDNKMEIFFTELDPSKFLVNSQRLFEREKNRNEQIRDNIQNKLGNISEKVLNKKIKSDSLLEKYAQMLNKAIKLNQKTSDKIILGTSIIMRNNQEVYFLIDGYNEEYREIHSSHILKWAIISKCYELGYRVFNLGEIHENSILKENKYHGMYQYKIGFGGKIVEYSPSMILVINKNRYSTYMRLNKIKPIWKR